MKRALCSLIGRSMLFALAFAGASLAAPGVAAAVIPSCDTTVKHSITLTGDMTCGSDGLIVGKSGITIDLNHHTITGSGTYDSDGVVSYDHNNVTVENGTVHGFFYGVLYEYTGGSKILHIKASGNYNGINFWYSANGLIDHSTATGSADGGISLLDNGTVNVANSNASGNTDYGVDDDYSHATLDHVSANSNGSQGVYVDYPLIVRSKTPAYYKIENSTADNNGGYGFEISDNLGPEYQADLVGNTANNNTQYGFYAEDRTKGGGNHATGNGTNCYHVPCG